MGISKRGASVGTHGDKDLSDLVQERSPDGRPRDSLSGHTYALRSRDRG